MDDQISWHVLLAVKPGRLADFRALTGEMVEATRSEPGVLGYERFVTEDGRFVHAYERYENAAAALAHLRHFRRRFAERFAGMVDRERFVVHGKATGELKDMLDGFGAVYVKPLGDFEYWAWRRDHAG